jgi:peptidoglycan-associated lipoprotein
MRERITTLSLLLGAAITLAACGGMTQKDQGAAQVDERSTTEGGMAAGGGAGATTGGLAAGGIHGSSLDDPNSVLSKHIVYFDFDQSDIKPEYRAILEAHAEYLADHPEATITLEGYADERGTREYNIALGDRRANAVEQLMTVLGASGQQIRTVSYGEERPAAQGHDEAAWSKNRRVQIVYRNRG